MDPAAMERLLSKGAVQCIIRGEQVTNPVFQILGFKKISGQAGADRFRLSISDGDHCHNFAMLATQYNPWISEGKLDSFAIIRCDKIMANTVNESRKVVIILDLTVLHKGSDVKGKLGNPQQYNGPADPPAPKANGTANRPQQQPYTTTANIKPKFPASDAAVAAPSKPSTFGFNQNKPVSAPQPGKAMAPPMAGNPAYGDFVPHVVPIHDISPYQSKCAIKARITKKGPLRTWTNAKGEGKVFNLDLLDDSGEIRLSGFTAAADMYYDILEENQVYFFRNFQVKNANRQFCNLDNDYELQFTQETQLLPCLENNDNIPTITYNFVDIASIEQADNNSFVDVIGICKRVGDLQRFTSRTTNKEFVKRDIYLVDKTNREIALTLWDKVAEEFTDDSQPVVAAKRVKVSDYSGKSLSLPGSSLFQVNPDIQEAHFLRGWYDNEGSKLNPQSLTASRAPGSGGGTQWKLLREANNASELLGDKPDYFMSKVMIMSFKRDSVLYKACPTQDCRKKVVDNTNGQYRCEKCQQDFSEFRWRVMLQVDFADCSDHLWATCFQETGEQILGHDSEELGKMYTERQEEFDVLLQEVLFSSYIVKFRSKMENFNGENRLKATVMELHPVKYAEYAKQLMAEIRECSDN